MATEAVAQSSTDETVSSERESDNEIQSFNLFTIVMQILSCFSPAIESVAMQMKQQLTAMDRVRFLDTDSGLDLICLGVGGIFFSFYFCVI